MCHTGTVSLEAPCKVNLHLRILGKRPDGFHNLESIFALLAFGDTLSISAGGAGNKIFLKTEYEGPCAAFIADGGPAAAEFAALPAEKNLAYRAASLFREKTDFKRDIFIDLVKRVPPGSGLGGGSSDAAAVLSGLNTLSGASSLPGGDLHSLAARLGSDVPFFLGMADAARTAHAARTVNAAAWVSGRGETVKPVDAPLSRYGVILVFPPFSSSTAEAFATLDKNRKTTAAGPAAAAARDKAAGRNRLAAAIRRDPESWPFKNDFLAVFGERYRKVLTAVSESGAAFAGLSGSGSACFGIYPGLEAAQNAETGLSAKDYHIIKTFFLRSGG